MTKKHFIALAAEIKSKFRLDCPWGEVNEETRSHALVAVEVICDVAHRCNPRFDETRFRIACGVPA